MTETDRTLNHDLRRDGPLRGVYGGLTMRPDVPGDPRSLNHPVAVVRRPDGQVVALHLTDAALLRRFTEERPQRGDAIGVYHARNGRPDVVRQRLDYLDPDDSERPARTAGGTVDLPESEDDRILLHLAAQRYAAEHPGVGDAVSAHQPTAEERRLVAALNGGSGALRPAETGKRPAPAGERQFSTPPRQVTVDTPWAAPASLELARSSDYIDGLSDGVALADDPYQRQLAEAMARNGDGNPAAAMTRTR